MKNDDLDDWINTYILAQESSESIHENHPHFWAIERFIDSPNEAPEECWEAILGVLNREPSQKVIAVLAAGPLEDLIEAHGAEYIERVEYEARKNPRFRHLLGGVWESGTPEIWKRVEQARVKAW
jgi:hypothetical protein